MSENNQDIDRREYYRIDDDIIFNYRVICENSVPTDKEKKVSVAFDMIELFGQMNQQMRVTLGRIGERSADIASYLKSLDSKIELLAEINLFKENQDSLGMRQKINLGAGGLSFVSNEELKEDTLIEVDLILSTDLTCLHLNGQVVNVRPNKEDNSLYNIAISFNKTTALEEDKIIKHIMNLQSEQLRANRESY